MSDDMFLRHREYHRREVILLRFILNELPKLVPGINTDDFEFQEVHVNPPHAVKPRIKTTDNPKDYELYRYFLVTLRLLEVMKKEIRVMLRLKIGIPQGKPLSLHVDGYNTLPHNLFSPDEEIVMTNEEFASVSAN